MLDLLRNLRKSNEEQRQEALTAYLDDALSPAERKRFEKQMAADSQLQAAYQQQRIIKESLSQLPRMKAPRYFTLDPAQYGAPDRQMAPVLYPVLQTATVLAALVFVLALVLDFAGGTGSFGASDMQETADEVAVLAPSALAEEAAEAEEVAPVAATPVVVFEEEVVVTRVVEAEVVAEEAIPAQEAPMAEMAAEEMAAEEPTLTEASDDESEEAVTESAAADASTVKTEEAGIQPMATETDDQRFETQVPATASPAPTSVPTPSAAVAEMEVVPTVEGRAVIGEGEGESEIPPAELASRVEDTSGEPQDVGTESDRDATSPESEPLPALRLIQLGMGVAVILLAVTSFYVRRRL